MADTAVLSTKEPNIMFANNSSGRTYGLTLLCPIKNETRGGRSCAQMLSEHLENLGTGAASPMAKAPNTYLARFYILNDVFYQGHGFEKEHLKSRYLVFSTNFHGDRDTYIRGMWECNEVGVKAIWRHCVDFETVKNAQDFVDYVRRCQVDNALFFNGSTDDPVAEQLKALYLKQEFTRFAFDNHGESPEELQKRFREFVELTRPGDLKSPTWQPGSTDP